MADSGEFITVLGRIDSRLDLIQSDVSAIKIDNADSKATANAERQTLRRDLDRLDREKAHRDDVKELDRRQQEAEQRQKDQRTFVIKAASAIAGIAGTIFSIGGWIISHLGGSQ